MNEMNDLDNPDRPVNRDRPDNQGDPSNPGTWRPTAGPAQADASGHDPSTAPGRRFRRNVVAVGAALGLTFGGLGIAAAQTQGSTSTSTPAPATGGSSPAPRPPGPGRRGPGAGTAAAAKAIGISEADLETALESGRSISQVAQSKGIDPTTVIAAMVADGKAHLADEAAGLEARITDEVNRVGGPGHDGPRGGGPGRPGPGAGAAAAAAAKAIGISEAELRTALMSGQSIAQVAQSKGVDPASVIAAMVTDAKGRLADEVKAGRLTQAQADERAAGLEQRITDEVNHAGGPGRRGPGHGPGRP